MGKKKQIKQLKREVRRQVERVEITWGDYMGLRKDICAMHVPNRDGLCEECFKPFPCPSQLRAISGGLAVAGEDIIVTLNTPSGDSYAHYQLEKEQRRSDLVFDMAEPLWIPQGESNDWPIRPMEVVTQLSDGAEQWDTRPGHRDIRPENNPEGW